MSQAGPTGAAMLPCLLFVAEVSKVQALIKVSNCWEFEHMDMQGDLMVAMPSFSKFAATLTPVLMASPTALIFNSHHRQSNTPH